MSCAAFSSPCCRSPWAPWIETLPNTAIAPVAAIATARERPARSSLTAMCGTALVTFRAGERSKRASHRARAAATGAARTSAPPCRRSRLAAGRASVSSAISTKTAPSAVRRRVLVLLRATSRGAIAASGSRERMSRSGLSTATKAASIPPATAITTLCAADDARRADGEGGGEEAGVGVKQLDRELVAEHEADRAADRAEHGGVEQQHGDHGARRVAVAAQVGDQPAALGDGQEHRVEREEEADERADHGEQHGRLVGGGGGLGEQLLVVARRGDVRAAPRRGGSARPAPPARDPGSA